MRNSLIFSLLVILFALPTSAALAHGAESHVDVDGSSITVTALYDTGEVMSEAQVVVYTPDDPQNGWLTGVADKDGVYQFELDNSMRGRWAVSIRAAGHGEILYLNVAADGTVSAEADSSGLVRTILAVVVVIALAGVAAFFSRNQKQPMQAATLGRS